MKHYIKDDQKQRGNRYLYVDLQSEKSLEENALKNAGNPSIAEKKLLDDCLKAIPFEDSDWCNYVNFAYQCKTILGENMFRVTYTSNLPIAY